MRSALFVFLMLFFIVPFCFGTSTTDKMNRAYRYLNSQQYPEAIELLEELYHEDESNIKMRKALGTAYNNYATKLRRAKDDMAFDYYEKALELTPNQPILRYNYASALYDMLRYEDAIYQLEYMYGKLSGVGRHRADMLLGLSYFKLNDFSRAGYYFDEVDPAKTPESLFYQGFIEYKTGDIDRAISIWKDFKSNYPWVAAKFNTSQWINKAGTENRVENRFSQDTTSHFMVNSDVEDDRIDINFILTSFEEAYYDVGRELEIYPKNRIPVVIYSSHKQYRNATNSPEWTGGLWDGTKIRIPSSMATTGKKRLKHTIFHEYVHLLLSTEYEKTYRNIPVWLNEGCAEFLSHYILEEKVKSVKLTPDAKKKLLGFYTNPAYFKNARTVHNAYSLALHSVRYIYQQYGNKNLLELIENFAKGDRNAVYNSLNISLSDFIDGFIRFMK